MTKPDRERQAGNGVAPSQPLSTAPVHPAITVGKIRVDIDAGTVEVKGRRVRLSDKEYQVLELLVLRKGSTLTKEMLLNHLYGGIDEPGLKIIDVFICKLRKKLQAATGGHHYIETVWGRGYVLRDPNDKGNGAE